jgi:predicted nucleic acid-binding protein
MIIADSGFWLALFDRNDNHHVAVYNYTLTINEAFITTLPVITEVCYLLQTRCYPSKATDFLAAQTAGLFQLFNLTQLHLPRMAKLMIQYNNLPMDLADASLVVLAEDLGHGRIVSTDKRDFNTYRWKNHYPFTNLLAELL